MYERFKVTNPFGVVAYYAFAEAPVAFLETPIPQAALNKVYGVIEDEEGNVTPKVTDKVLRDFTLSAWPSLDGTKVIVCLGAQEFTVGRWKPVTADDLADWEQYLSPYGFDSSKWLTKDGAVTLCNSAEYTTPEGTP